jgi:hypothetical protein
MSAAEELDEEDLLDEDERLLLEDVDERLLD